MPKQKEKGTGRNRQGKTAALLCMPACLHHALLALAGLLHLGLGRVLALEGEEWRMEDFGGLFLGFGLLFPHLCCCYSFFFI